MAKSKTKFGGKTDNEQLKEIYSDIDDLMSKILGRLDGQSDIIVAGTKLRVARLFINQIAEGGNKVYLTDQLKKIESKIMTMQVEEEDVDEIPRIGTKE